MTNERLQFLKNKYASKLDPNNVDMSLVRGGHGPGRGGMSKGKPKNVKATVGRTDDAANFLGQTFCAAQDILMAEQIARNAKKKMKTTCVAIATDDRNAYVGHIGDSRGYIFYKNKVKTRTLDHSIPQMLVLSGE